MKDEQEQGTGKGEIDGTWRCTFFGIHSAEDAETQKQGVEENEGGCRDDSQPPVVEEEQDGPYPHTCSDVDDFAGQDIIQIRLFCVLSPSSRCFTPFSFSLPSLL